MKPCLEKGMGVGQRKKKGNKGGHNTKNKEYKKKHATRRRAMDVDQVSYTCLVVVVLLL